MVLEALQAGLPVPMFGQREVWLGESDGGPVLYVERDYERGGVAAAKKLLALDISLSDFLAACERLPDEARARIAMDLALTKHKRAEARAR